MEIKDQRPKAQDLLFDRYSVTQLVNVARSHLLIRAHPAFHFNQVAFSLSQLHESLLRMTVLDHEHATHAWFSFHGSNGNEYCRLRARLKNAHRRELSRLQHATAVFYFGFYSKSARVGR